MNTELKNITEPNVLNEMKTLKEKSINNTVHHWYGDRKTGAGVGCRSTGYCFYFPSFLLLHIVWGPNDVREPSECIHIIFQYILKYMYFVYYIGLGFIAIKIQLIELN